MAGDEEQKTNRTKGKVVEAETKDLMESEKSYKDCGFFSECSRKSLESF